MPNLLDCNRIPFFLLLQAMVFCSAAAEDAPRPPTSEGRPDYCGVWGIWGGERVSTEGRPWFKGVVVTSEWNRIEPRPGEFDWDPFDNKVREVVNKGLTAMIMIYHGHKAPDWVYDQGVPRVETDARQHKFHPYYLAPAYKPLLSRMIHATAEHVAAYPPEIRDRIVGVQCPTGKSGDPQPYDGEPLEEKYRIDPGGQAWVDWTLAMFPVYHAAYAERSLDVFLMFKGPNPQSNDWLMEHLPDSWRKPHMIAQGYQFNNELRVMNDLYPRTRRRIDGVLIRTRGELDNTSAKGQNWFNAAPVWNVYWAGLWNLTYGIDIWNQLAPALEDEQFAEAFEFVSRYAGYKTPSESPGAWIALRDGLDCADIERFPEDRFGAIGPLKPWQTSQNPDRYKRIADAFSQYGAANDDVKNIGANGLDVRRQKGLNDVGYRIWSDNYGLFLTQHDPQGTSRGHWRVGSKHQPYGRFARGFCHAEGNNAMYFRIDDGFFVRDVPPGRRRVVVRVVYFDRGRGQWALRYDGGGEAPATAIVVENTDSGRWREAFATIHDGHFARGCPEGTDLMLVNLDEEDKVFHMIELVRKTRQGSGLSPAESFRRISSSRRVLNRSTHHE